MSDFEFIVLDKASKCIKIKQGHWDVDNNLTIEKGYTVVCTEGTSLNLRNSANILSYSPLRFLGAEDNPISIYSSDGTGQGVIVMNADRQSELRYVNFNNLSDPTQEGWGLTGAVTFYESPVNIFHCQFLNNRSEDSLNLIRSEFSMDYTLFDNSSSDAFDGDFCNGSIMSSSFVNSGNDAIDVSGSDMVLRDVLIDGAGDKGISVGENSHAKASGITIKNTEIGVASKDMSEIIIDDINLTSCKIGFASYQKKPEFGPARIIVNSLIERKTKKPYMVESGSEIIFNGKKMVANQEKIEEILYGTQYGKSSK